MSLEWLRVVGLHWYDRNPESKVEEYSFELAPHAQGVRVTYACPPDKKAMVEQMSAEVVRTTAAGVAGTPSCRWEFTPKEGENKIILMAWLCAGHNTVGNRSHKQRGGNLMMYPGDKLEGSTGDGSTGGEVYHSLFLKLTEFDAFPIEEPTPSVQEPEAVKDPVM